MYLLIVYLNKHGSTKVLHAEHVRRLVGLTISSPKTAHAGKKFGIEAESPEIQIFYRIKTYYCFDYVFSITSQQQDLKTHS